MKILQATIFSLLASTFVKAQVFTSIMEQNNARIHVLDNGSLFNNFLNSTTGYIIPKTGVAGIMYGLNINMIGTDSNGDTYFSKSIYDEGNWSGGPIRNDYTQIPTQSISCIDKNLIDYHMANFQEDGYIMPAEISSWPAHGDTTNGEAWILAPYNDVDENGVYNPENGDYPCIKGDYCCYIIINDSNPDEQIMGLTSLGIEAHIMVYQFNSTNNAVNNASYFDVKAYNRSSINYEKFILGIYMDGDIGGYSDDYIGTDIASSTMYFYNSSLFDGNAPGVPGYGENPPAAGITNMNDDMYMTNYIPSVYEPLSVHQLFNVFSGRNIDGTIRPENFIYPGNYTGGVSEFSESNPTGDRRGYSSYGRIDLNAGDSYEWNFAITFGRDLDAQHIFSSVETMLDNTLEVKAHFGNIENCAINTAMVSEKLTDENFVRVFPNPASTTLNIESEFNSTVLIANSLGQQITSFEMKNGIQKLDISEYPEGIYFATLTSESSSKTVKWIKN